MHRIPLRSYLLEALLRVALPLFGVALLVAGLSGVVSFGVVPIYDAMRSRQWTPVPATLQAVRLDAPALLHSRPLPALAVRYSYRFAGGEFVGERPDLHHGLDLPDAVRQRLRELGNGRELVAWVNPRAPEQAMLDRSLHWGVVVLSIPAGMIALVGGLLVFGGMVLWNDWQPLWRGRDVAAVPPPHEDGGD